MEPVIGITCGIDREAQPHRHYVAMPYVEAVAAAGGMPVLLPYVTREELTHRMVAGLHGLLLPGGYDVDPARFEEDPLPGLGRVDPLWDELEVRAARQALDDDIPILGICRGIQVLNVAAGGSLVQDIPGQVERCIKHYQQGPRWYASHDVSLADNSCLEQIFAMQRLKVNSFHHQAVKEAAPGFHVTARAADGVVEGLESRQHTFAVGVQWHPEAMWQHNPLFLELFRALVDAARARQGKVGSIPKYDGPVMERRPQGQNRGRRKVRRGGNGAGRGEGRPRAADGGT